MLNKLLIAPIIVLCVLTLSISAQAQTAKKKVKKTVVTTTTEEVDENGKTIKKTEKVESEADDSANDAPKKSGQWEQGSSTPPPAYDSSLPTRNEPWYTLWGLGFSKASYSGDLGDAYEDAEDGAGVDRSATVNVDILGFYWPLEGHKTMLGFIINGAGDTMEAGGNELSLYTYLMGFSAHHFFGRNIGDGWFVRGDAGLAWSVIQYDFGSYDTDDKSDMEIGVMFGGGYGFAIGQDTRLLVGLYIRPLPKMDIEGDEIKGTVTNVTAGFLF